MLVGLDSDWSEISFQGLTASFIRQDESNPRVLRGVLLRQDTEGLVQATLLSRVCLTLVSLLRIEVGTRLLS